MFGRWRRRNRRAGGRGTSFPGSALHVCPECHAPFVSPLTWSELGDTHWLMALRCGECGHERGVVVGDDVARRYDQDLGRATQIIARALAREDRERLAREADVFAAALRRDLIDAADFAR
jgi:hypothetical protein